MKEINSRNSNNTTKHSNISIFVPHNGCPHQCTFCNQKNITGQQSQPTPIDVKNAIKTAIISGADTSNTEIAFFGGSFTAIDREYMISLLDATRPYIKDFYGIRCSTRPDAVDGEILKILKSYGVTSIELGAQSMCDDVLGLNERGHTANDVIKASRLIQSYGISLGLQMMTGLYGSNIRKDYYTAQKIIELNPDTVRIYPTITLKNTPLEILYNDGSYTPCDRETTINCCSEILQMFYDSNINVIRVGLHYSDELKDNYIAGFYHPAFRELCESRMFYRSLLNNLNKNYQKGNYEILVGNKFISKAIGQKKENTNKLKDKGYIVKFISTDNIEDFSYIIR
ncbi:MAG: radical SAM protein [Oscillospiraceae bacterium]|nr:radical SAM protein [Oscillospiraceae bacterium]